MFSAQLTHRLQITTLTAAFNLFKKPKADSLSEAEVPSRGSASKYWSTCLCSTQHCKWVHWCPICYNKLTTSFHVPSHSVTPKWHLSDGLSRSERCWITLASLRTAESVRSTCYNGPDQSWMSSWIWAVSAEMFRAEVSSRFSPNYGNRNISKLFHQALGSPWNNLDLRLLDHHCPGKWGCRKDPKGSGHRRRRSPSCQNNGLPDGQIKQILQRTQVIVVTMEPEGGRGRIQL